MNLLAHRGFWKTGDEKNTFRAIKRAFDYGYGIETDIRDFNGKLVISHNIADAECIGAEQVFKEYFDKKCIGTMALNIKADGMQTLLKPMLQKYNITNYFLFDMSIPELVINEKEKLVFYTRHSDIETQCVRYENAAGVWLDNFYDCNWLTLSIIKQHLEKEKPVCIVSPELHNKDYMGVWNLIKEAQLYESKLVSLCTDIPDKARRFFYGKD